MLVVLGLVIASIPTACSAVGLPDPLSIEGEAPQAEITALVPMTNESRCVFVAVQTADPDGIATVAGVTLDEVADVLGEMANMAAGISAAGTDFTLGLPVVFRGAALIAPPSAIRRFEVDGVEFAAGLWG